MLVLAARLALCTELVLKSDAPSLDHLFGTPDHLKFCSSMTLFALASHERDSPYHRAIETWCHHTPDPLTLDLVSKTDR